MNSIELNGTARHVGPGTTVADLVTATTGRTLLDNGQAADGGRLGVAVARNAELVPRSQWSSTAVEPADSLEIVTAVQGG